MKALSIRQPWAWLIISGGKDIENRTWHTKFRGRFLVHAASGMTRREFLSAFDFMAQRGIKPPFPVPPDNLLRGGIIGSVELVDSVDHSESPWYMGEKGFVLRDPRPLPFIPMKGRLGFFDVPADAVCTCPSGDGSLRWPCPVHPPKVNQEALKALEERVMNDPRFCCDEHHRYLAEGVLALFNDCEALRKDAERYRFVRNPIGTSSPLAIWNEGKMPLFSGMADAVVDEFIAKEKQP